MLKTKNLIGRNEGGKCERGKTGGAGKTNL
jgi:hypothetical protein